MLTLTPDEARVLGSMIEKAYTVPGQYPLTLNSLVLACNQKNNRDPVTNLNEEQVLIALDGLRAKKLASEVMLSGSRVAKYRQGAAATLALNTAALVVLTELLLRGPQTLGELRGRASRMHPLDSIESVHAALEELRCKEQPMVQEIPAAPGDRAPRFVQLLAPGLHPLNAPAAPSTSPAAHSSRDDHSSADQRELEARIERLEHSMAELSALVHTLIEGAPAHRAAAVGSSS